MNNQEYMRDYIRGKRGSWGTQFFFKAVVHCLIISLVVLGIPIPPIPRIDRESASPILDAPIFDAPIEMANQGIDAANTIIEKTETETAHATAGKNVEQAGIHPAEERPCPRTGRGIGRGH